MSFQAFSQCEPIYTFRYGNFGCQDASSFCILLNSDDNPNCPNEDLFIQIEYAKNEFIETEWFGFNRIQSGPPNEIWEDEVEWISGSLDQEYCFEGLIQDPDVEVIIRFVDKSVSPEVVLKEDVYKLKRNLVTIGNGGTVQLSNLVGNQLLTATQALTQSQQFILDGILEVDIDYIFGFDLSASALENELIMTSGSEIRVVDFKELGFRRARLTSCGIWKGIAMTESTTCRTSRFYIENAERAFDMGKLSKVQLSSSLFRNNEHGIHSVFPSATTIELDIFTSSTLGGIQSVKFESNDNSPFSFDVGIYTRNASNIRFGGFVIFNGLNTGIDASGTRLFIGNPVSFGARPVFENLQNGIVASNTPQIEVSAYFWENSKHGIIFNRVENTTIKNCHFENIELAIKGTTGIPNVHSLIDDNDFFNVTQGIVAILNPGRGEIQYNDMSANDLGIFALGLNVGSHTWSIQNNDKLNCATGHNVKFRRTNLARIHENHDMNSGGSSNVEVRGGTENYVGCNIMDNVVGNNLHINASEKFDIYCNDISSISQSNVLIKNNCGQCSVRTQIMSSSGFNLEYDPLSLTGPQAERSNVFDLSTQVNPKAFHDGSIAQASRSQYIVPNLFWRMNKLQGESEYYPFFDSDFDDWFDDIGGEPSICGSACLPGIIEGSGEEEHANVLYDYINTGLAGSNGQEVEFDAKLKLMRSLLKLDDDNNLSGNLLSYFYANQTTEAYHLAYVEHQLAASTEMSAADLSSIEQLEDDLAILVGQYQNIFWYSFDPNTGEVVIDTVAQAQMDTIMTNIETKTNDITIIRAPYESAWFTELGSMLTYNANINTTTVSGGNLKLMNSINIYNTLNETETLTPAQLAQVQSVGSMCYVEGGEGVLLARNLESAHLGEMVEYSDDCNNNQSLQKGPISTEKMTAIPNPSLGESVFITSNKEKVAKNIEIIDMMGRIMLTTKSEQYVNLNQLSPGIYYIRSSNKESSHIITGKIVIDKK